MGNTSSAVPMIGETAIRVRYAETDTMGVVYYGNYLTYFEVGRVEFLRQHGLPMSEVDRKLSADDPHPGLARRSARDSRVTPHRAADPGMILYNRHG
jgi:hypothetical protein